jgi:3-oxoacyl-[acyl-carrier-protein] synthase III
MTYSRIAGLGSYLPEKILTNKDLESMVDTNDEWILKRVGIKKRHIIADDQGVDEMASIAARRALDAAGLEPSDIDMIICGNATPDYYFPSIACFVQDALGIPDIPVFDVAAACAGFIYGLSIADQYIKNNAAARILVIGVEALSRVVDWTDRSTCVLFGDGAGAAVLEASDTAGIISTHIHADGKYKDMLFGRTNLPNRQVNTRIEMDGNAIFRIAVKKLHAAVDETLEKNNLEKHQIDWLIPHQANMRIIQATAKRLDMPMERVVLTVGEHGNTSAASVPLAMDHAVREGRVKRGDLCLLEAFGAGFAWGAALVRF